MIGAWDEMRRFCEGTKVLTLTPEMQPYRKMPIWALLMLAEMIPSTYFWDDERQNPRKISEVKVLGFQRHGDTIVIHFEMSWPNELGGLERFRYIWPAIKSGRDEDEEYFKWALT